MGNPWQTFPLNRFISASHGIKADFSDMNPVRQQSSLKPAALALLPGGIVLVAVLVILRFGRYTLARPSLISDDEGYLLLTLKHYFAGEHLYTQVFTQYGPFYFLIQKAIFGLLHLPVTFDAGRLVFLGYWVLASLLGGLFVYRVSKSVTLASATALAVMWLERVMAFEPNHPEQMVIVLLMAGCLVSVKPNRVSFLLLGAIGAAAFCTKTNVGLFFVAAALIAAGCVLPAGRVRNVGGKLLLVAVIVGPVILMHNFLNTWARGFCVLSVLAGASTVMAGLRARVYPRGPLRTFPFLIAGAAVAAILITLGSTLEGIPIRGLVNGVLLASVRQADVFCISFVATKVIVLLAAVLSASMASLYWAPQRARHAGWVDALKCVAGLVVIGLLVKRDGWISGSESFGFAITYALLPLALLPGKAARWEASEFFPRVFVTALAAMQILQAYPVAGSQVNIGAAPFLLWGFVCVYDGAGGLFDLVPSAKNWRVPIAEAPMLGALVFAALVFQMFRTGMLQAKYPFPASSLRGSSSLHLPPELEAQDETLAGTIQANCTMLFTMPGMGSFNFWSGVPTPDGFNEDNWMRGVPLFEQQQTLQKLESNPSACVLVRPMMLSVWGVPDGGIDTLPLAHYILHDMPVVFGAWGPWGYEIRVSPNRRAPWIEPASAAAR
jgi:hypothetical protein